METVAATDSVLEFEVQIVSKDHATFARENKGRFASFPQAFATFYCELNKSVEKGLPQVLLPSNTIGCYHGGELIGLLMFDQVKCLANQTGLLVDHKLAEPIVEFNYQQAERFQTLLVNHLIIGAEAAIALFNRPVEIEESAIAGLFEEQTTMEKAD